MGTAGLSAGTERSQSLLTLWDQGFAIEREMSPFQDKKSDLSSTVSEKIRLINSGKYIYLNSVSATQPWLFYWLQHFGLMVQFDFLNFDLYTSFTETAI